MTDPATIPEAPLPFKRGRRKTGRETAQQAHIELAIVIAKSEAHHRIASQLDRWEPGDVGRPPQFPQAIMDLFGMLSFSIGSDRRAAAFFTSHINWEPIRKLYAERYPHHAGLRPGGLGPTRSQFWRNYDGIAGDELRLRLVSAALTQEAAVQARAMGNCDPGRTGYANLCQQDLLSGDGTVLTSRFKHGAGSRQVDRETGEITEKRYDPDARSYVTGDKRRVTGIPYVLTHTRTGYENEWIVASVTPVQPSQGEFEAALTAIRDIVVALPGLKGIIWDMAMHGVHIDALYSLGLISLAKVVRAPGGGPKDLLLGPQDTIRGQTVIVRAVDGAAHIELPTGSGTELVRLPRPKIQRRENRDGTIRWYGEYTLPAQLAVPSRLRGDKIRIRLDGTDEDVARGSNRAENLRPIAVGDEGWGDLYTGRPVAESLNAWFKRLWGNGRAPAIGRHRNHLRLIYGAMLANTHAAIAFQKRTGSWPDELPAAA